MAKSNTSQPQEPDFSGWEAYRPFEDSGHLQVLYVFGWWEKYPELPRSRILKEAHEKLVKAGADPGFATKVLTSLTESPNLRCFQAIYLAGISPDCFREFDHRAEQIEKLQAMIQPLDALAKAPIFTSYPLAFQIQVMTQLRDLSNQSVALHEAQFAWYVAIVHRHPLFGLLEREAGIPIRKSRPPMPLANLFMALLTDHIFERTGKRNYLEVGYVAQALFPGCFAQHIADPSHVQRAVLDRVRKFKRQYARYLTPLHDTIVGAGYT